MQNWPFVRIVDSSGQHSAEDIAVLVARMVDEDENDNGIPAGYTYFGQFIAHDLSHLRGDLIPPPGQTVPIEDLQQARRPSLDLDSIYGGGLDDSVVTYSCKNGKFLLGETSAGRQLDLHRRSDGRPLVADQRNDENLLVAQMHVLFQRYHNALVDQIASKPGPHSAESLFQAAREEVVASYQHLVLHDFAKHIVPESVYNQVIIGGKGRLLDRSTEHPTIAIEFAGAAFRLGHSMVRPTYRMGPAGDSVPFSRLRELTARTISHSHPLPDNENVDWGQFFVFRKFADWGNGTKRADNHAFSISPTISGPMRSLSHGVDVTGDTIRISMIRRNIERGVSIGLPSAQQVHEKMLDLHDKLANGLGLALVPDPPLLDGLPPDHGLRLSTPLWPYILMEARHYTRSELKPGESKLGILGGWIVADGLKAACEFAQSGAIGSWRPSTSLLAKKLKGSGRLVSDSDFTIEDIIAYTGR